MHIVGRHRHQIDQAITGFLAQNAFRCGIFHFDLEGVFFFDVVEGILEFCHKFLHNSLGLWNVSGGYCKGYLTEFGDSIGSLTATEGSDAIADTALFQQGHCRGKAYQRIGMTLVDTNTGMTAQKIAERDAHGLAVLRSRLPIGVAAKDEEVTAGTGIAQ